MSKIYINVDGVDIEATGDALKEILDFQAQCKAEAETQKAQAEARATQKTALLDRLGITEEEAKLLLA